MKNKLFTLAGVLALLALIGKFYAGPAIAQTVRAALVQDRDSYPRQPFSILLNGPSASIPLPPAGKRMVITSMSFNVSLAPITVGPISGVVYTAATSEGRQYFNEYTLAPVPGQLIGNFVYNWVLDPDGDGSIQLLDLQSYNYLDSSFYVTGYYIDVP